MLVIKDIISTSTFLFHIFQNPLHTNPEKQKSLQSLPDNFNKSQNLALLWDHPVFQEPERESRKSSADKAAARQGGGGRLRGYRLRPYLRRK